MEKHITAEALARVLPGLEEYPILDASEDDDGLVVEVIATRPGGPCPGCGTFSSRVKS